MRPGEPGLLWRAAIPGTSDLDGTTVSDLEPSARGVSTTRAPSTTLTAFRLIGGIGLLAFAQVHMQFYQRL